MSTTIAMIVICERDGCTSAVTIPDVWTAGDARRVAADRYGWTSESGKDVCHECAWHKPA